MPKRPRVTSSDPAKKRGQSKSFHSSEPDATPKQEESVGVSASAVSDGDSSGGSDDEDDGEDDDEFEESCAYNAGQERPPFHVAYNPSLDNMKAAVHREMVGYKVFADNGEPPLSPDMLPLVQRYEAVKAYPSPRPIIIGLVGAASAGKSTVINTTLDCKNLAIAASAGSSCTNVVTEFCAAPPNQKEKFAANIMYLDSSEIEQLLRQHVHDVLMMQHADEENWTLDERDQGRRKVSTAVTTFNTIFADRQEFGSREATLQTIKATNEKEIDGFLRPLLHRCAQLIVAAGSSLITAITADKLNQKLSTFTQPNASSCTKTGKPGMWPLVGKVKVTLREWHVLDGLKHLVFADIPGLQDENLARVDAAKKYLATCDALWVVSNINRVKDDTVTAGLLDFAITRHQNKAALIVTRADLHLDEPAFKALRNDSPESIECFHRLSKEKKIAKQQTDFAEICKHKHNRESRHQLQAVRERLELDFEDAHNQFKDALMQLRNQSVVDHMRELTKQRFPKGARLQVFCVANELYEMQSAVGNSRRANSAGITNVPALRQYALLLPTTSMYRSDKDFITGPYQDFLTGVDAWTKDAFLHDSNAVIEAIEKLRETAIARVREHCSTNDQVVESLIFDHMRQKEDLYSQIAINVSKSWERYKWHSYRNHCSQNGSLTRRDGSKLSSWNEELTAKMTEDMASHCFHMSGYKQSMEMGIITAELVGYMKDIKTEARMNVRDVTRLAGFGAQVDAQCEKIKELILQDFAAQSALIRELGVRMSMDVYRSIVGRIMKPVYALCASEHGGGMQKRMYGYMQKHMTSGKPFSHRVLTLAEIDYYDARKGCEERFAAQVGDIFRKLAENLRLMARQTTSHTNPMVETVRTSMADRVTKALVIYGDMMATFKELETSASGFDF